MENFYCHGTIHRDFTGKLEGRWLFANIICIDHVNVLHKGSYLYIEFHMDRVFLWTVW